MKSSQAFDGENIPESLRFHREEFMRYKLVLIPWSIKRTFDRDTSLKTP
jgi:hypothetical protein